MKPVTQADLAKTMGCSEMQVSRLARALYRQARPLTDLDALRVLAVPEIAKAGFTTTLAVQLLVENSSEFQYLAADPARKCWLAFCMRDEDGNEVQLCALKSRHLESIIDAFPLTLVLPLHNIVAAAKAELARTKGRAAA